MGDWTDVLGVWIILVFVCVFVCPVIDMNSPLEAVMWYHYYYFYYFYYNYITRRKEVMKDADKQSE